MIKNIVFDMGQVLIHFRPAELLQKYDLSKEDQNVLLKEVFGRTEWLALDDGTISEEDAVTSICTRVDAHLYGYVEDLVKNWWKNPFIEVEGMDRLIEILKNTGYGIYLLSNANMRQQEYFSRLPSAHLFDGRVTSAEIHMLKPCPDIYQYLLAKFQLEAKECLFIDDSNMNCYMAEKLGFKAYVFKDNMAELIQYLKKENILK